MLRGEAGESSGAQAVIEVNVPTARAMAAIEIPMPSLEEHRVPTYTARVRPDPKNPNYWLAELVDEPRVHTFGRSMPEAIEHLGEASKLWFRMDANVPIKLKVRLGEKIDADLEKTELLRDLITAISNQWSDSILRLVSTLVGDLKLSRREAGTILGFSPQRIQQLVQMASQAQSGTRKTSSASIRPARASTPTQSGHANSTMTIRSRPNTKVAKRITSSARSARRSQRRST